MILEVHNLSIHRQKSMLLSDISFSVSTGELVGIIGPNGVGKTTLMRSILGLVEHSGQCNISQLPTKERAKIAAWMPQEREIAWPISVEKLVALGTMPHRQYFGKAPHKPDQKVTQALKDLHLLPLKDRPATQLSGGEKARVLLARALAQDTPLLLADEPIAGLDPAQQISTMRLFATLAQKGKAIVLSLHDLSLAARYCTRLIVLGEGKMVSIGAPSDVLTEQNLKNVFQVRAWQKHTSEGHIFQPMEVI